LSRPTCLDCPVEFQLPCPRFHVPNVLSWLCCHCCPVLVALSQLSYLCCHVGSLSSLSCPGSLYRLSPLGVLSRLSYHGCPVSAALSQLSCRSSPIPAVLSRLSCPSCLVPAVCHSTLVPSASVSLSVMSWQPFPLCSVQADLSGLNCSDCPITVVLSHADVLSQLSFSSFLPQHSCPPHVCSCCPVLVSDSDRPV
jgi:hypothetical protein